MWHLGTWVSDSLGSTWELVGINDLRGLPNLNHSMIQWNAAGGDPAALVQATQAYVSLCWRQS